MNEIINGELDTDDLKIDYYSKEEFDEELKMVENDGMCYSPKIENKQSQAMQVLTSKKTVEYYTPPNYIDLVRDVFTHISLDPASNKKAQGWIKADNWYGLDHDSETERDGLTNPWFFLESPVNKIFVNPPYCGKTRDWIKKAESEYLKSIKQGIHLEIIVLASNAAGYVWWESLADKWTVCHVRERIRFIDAQGNQGGQAKKGSAFCYLGKNWEKFAEVFKKIGRITYPEVEIK